MRTVLMTFTACLAVVCTATAKYSGGTGEPNDPYQIATAADLIALGETPEDYDKHFILTADIDLDPNLPGRKVFDKAVIAPYPDTTGFTGVFNGNGHTVCHLTIAGQSHLGLFGRLGATYGSGAYVQNLGVVDVNIIGSGDNVGALVGFNLWGGVDTSYSTGLVSGRSQVGGVCGEMRGHVWRCFSTCDVSGTHSAGGLVGWNEGSVTHCYSTGAVSGTTDVGGLVGCNRTEMIYCYSRGAVRGSSAVGGLVGYNWHGTLRQSYSTGKVDGDSSVGGLVGSDSGDRAPLHGIWDTETSGCADSAGGVGLTTAEMMAPHMLGLNGFANDRNWVLDTGRDYPRLAWEGTAGSMIPEPKIDWLEGQGTVEAPYRIDTPDQLIFLGRAGLLWDRHFVLEGDIDLDPALPGRRLFGQAVIQTFRGVFDGNGHVISHLTIKGEGYLGLFGYLWSGEVKNLGITGVNIVGSGSYVGGLVGYTDMDSTVARCHSEGNVSGRSLFGGLVGYNDGAQITESHSHSTVSASPPVAAWESTCAGGLVGYNEGTLTRCYSTGAVDGTSAMGGTGRIQWPILVGPIGGV